MLFFRLRFGIEDGSRDQSALSAFPALGSAIGSCLFSVSIRVSGFRVLGLHIHGIYGFEFGFRQGISLRVEMLHGFGRTHQTAKP